MKIQLKNVVPHPFLDEQLAPTSLWGKEVDILPNKKVLVQAVSGKGKSTFINSIYGIRQDFEGNILLNGNSTKQISADQWSELRTKEMSVVFQDLQLIPHLTVEENLQLKNDLTNHKSKEEQQSFVSKVGLIDKWKSPIATLSYGQQQRIAIVRALLQPFSVILLDEPFAHLDKENSEICYSLIAQEAEKQKAGIILTTLNSTEIDEFDQYLAL